MSIQRETRGYTREKLREPSKYRVLMHNDDFTPMDFVVEVLTEIFRKDHDLAVKLMMTVHESGRAVVGTYSYDIAYSRVQMTADRAKKEGYPLRLTMEEV